MPARGASGWSLHRRVSGMWTRTRRQRCWPTSRMRSHASASLSGPTRPTLPIILGVPFTGVGAIAAAAAQGPDLVLFDAAVPGRHGGTGIRLDWEALAAARPSFAFGVAGGLRPDNVTQAIRLLRTAFVDVSSGVEWAPGIKDQDKVNAFMTAVRSA